MFKVVNLGAPGSSTPSSNPGLTGKPYAKTVDELCEILGKIPKMKSREARQALTDLAIQTILSSGQWEDSLYEAMSKYCPEQWESFKILTYEIVARRRFGSIPRSGYQVPTPTADRPSTTTPRSTSRTPAPTREPAREGVATPRSQTSTAQTGYINPSQVPMAEYAPVATQSQDSQYNQAIQNPIAPSYPQPSYADVATPSAAMPQAAATPGTTGMTPVQEATAGQYSWNRGTAQCAPPMIPDPSGRGCIPGTPTGYGGGGGLPGIPGGLTASVTAAPLTMTTPGVTGMSGRPRYPVVNL